MNLLQKEAIKIVLMAAAVFAALALWLYKFANAPAHQTSLKPSKNIMLLTSPSFENNGRIPKKFTCDGRNINPELQIKNVPQNAKSLALIMHDPDAPMPGGFTHWVVWNIAPTTTIINEGSAPPAGASEGMNSRNRGYTGPCPPSGTHHYEFRLYALDAVLQLAAASGKTELEAAMKGRVIQQTELVGLYER